MAKMEEVSVAAHAKVNFTLDVLGRRDGYHLLDSLVCTVSLADGVTARRARGITVSGAEGLPRRSNALRAAEAFCGAFGTGGAHITLARRIPEGAGLGGSSADAAGVLRALAKLYGITDMDALKSLADGLGSDTGYLLTGGWARMTGRGENIAPLADMPPLFLVLFLPPSGMGTAECFSEFDRRGEMFPAQTENAVRLLRAGNAREGMFGNALTAAACACNAQIGAALSAARALSPLAGMTGSGSACYAAFFTEEACRAAQARAEGRIQGGGTLCVRTLSEISSMKE